MSGVSCFSRESLTVNDATDDDERELRNLCHSAKKFVLRYVFLMVWLIASIYVFCKAYHVYNRDEGYYHLRKILGQGLCFSRGTASVINLTIVMIVLPVCKTFNKIVHKALGRVSSRLLAFYLEKLKVIHQCLAVTLVFASVIHSISHFVNAINFVKHFDPKLAEINWARDAHDNVFRLMLLTPTGFSGWTMIACLLVIWTFSTRQMREYFYNSFLGVHHLFLVLLVMMYYHPVSNIIKYQSNLTNSPTACDRIEKLNTSHAEIYMGRQCKEKPEFTAGSKNFWIWPSISLSIYIVDLIFRYLKRFFKRVKVVTMELPSRNVIFLTFKINTNVEFQPGQYILLQCENISALEWHPFTITDSIAGAGQTIFTLCVAVRGDWTGELYQKIFNLKLYSERSKRRRSRRRRRIPIPRKLIFVLDGPFPSVMESVLSKKRAVLIGAGIGVTPFISVFNYVMKTTKTLPLKRIHFIWITRDVQQLALFSKTLSDLTQMFWNDNQPDRIQMSFYVTRLKCGGVTMGGDEESFKPPEELFGKNAEFMMARVYAGRPDWHFLFNYWSSLYNQKLVSVYTCGPKALNKDVKKVCSRYNQKGFNFRLLHETLS